MVDLHSIVYVSTANGHLTLEEIEYLLERARERNKEYGITGVLLHINRGFMQYLEGPSEALQVIYKIIQDDPQHTGLIELVRAQLKNVNLVIGQWPTKQRMCLDMSVRPAKKRFLSRI